MCDLSVFVPFRFFKFHRILRIEWADPALVYSIFILLITLEHMAEVYFVIGLIFLHAPFFFFNSLWCMTNRPDQSFPFLVIPTLSKTISFIHYYFYFPVWTKNVVCYFFLSFFFFLIHGYFIREEINHSY